MVKKKENIIFKLVEKNIKRLLKEKEVLEKENAELKKENNELKKSLDVVKSILSTYAPKIKKETGK